MGGSFRSPPPNNCSRFIDSRILDASADSFRKGLLCFPIGLLALFGTSGLLFVVQMWSTHQSRHSDSNLEFIFHLVLVTKGAKELNKVYQMAKMEAAIHGVVLSESEPEIEHEVAAQQWFQTTEIQPCKFLPVVFACLLVRYLFLNVIWS